MVGAASDRYAPLALQVTSLPEQSSPATDNLPVPPCFDGLAQWEAWLAKRDEAGEDVDYCNDCLPRRQAQMIAEGRCEYPDTEFKLVRLEFFEKKLPSPEWELAGVRVAD